ncbi:MAG: hypothetical protein EG826_13205, partial [Deltaproteobacteria bacterium]|nr:hypothetical protein [Deltaproteobacteria bacterium]
VIEACQPANITAVRWNTNTTIAQTRCERVDIRNRPSMENVFSKYDGWKMIYISEYTTDKMFSTDSVVCFERMKP